MAKKPYNGLEALSKATGIKTDDLRQVAEDVRRNHEILRACTRHQFPNPVLPKLGQKHQCLNCGGWMSGERVSVYAEGVRHAGEPFPVWIDTPEAQG